MSVIVIVKPGAAVAVTKQASGEKITDGVTFAGEDGEGVGVGFGDAVGLDVGVVVGAGVGGGGVVLGSGELESEPLESTIVAESLVGANGSCEVLLAVFVVVTDAPSTCGARVLKR
jgi:hypothetical protein